MTSIKAELKPAVIQEVSPATVTVTLSAADARALEYIGCYTLAVPDAIYKSEHRPSVKGSTETPSLSDFKRVLYGVQSALRRMGS